MDKILFGWTILNSVFWSKRSSECSLCCGVPQGLCWVLFCLYCTPVICSHLFFRYPFEINDCRSSVLHCIYEVANWISINGSNNPDKFNHVNSQPQNKRKTFKRSLPSWRIPISSSTHPDRKQSKTANSGPSPCRFSLVRMAAMAVGPMGESLQEPNMVYTKQAMKDE